MAIGSCDTSSKAASLITFKDNLSALVSRTWLNTANLQRHNVKAAFHACYQSILIMCCPKVKHKSYRAPSMEQ